MTTGTPIRAILIAVALSLLLACTASEDSAEPAPLVRDSAGVTILETAATEQFPAPWTLGEPTVRIGQREGEVEYLLDRVQGALLLEGGRIAVANGGSNEIRIYDREGSFLTSLGGDGEGPGEYEYIRAMGRCSPEGFVGFDLHWGMKRYDEDGTFLSQRRVETLDGQTPYRFACDRKGRMAVIGWGDEMGARELGFYTVHDELVVMDSAGSVVADFGPWLSSERIGHEHGSGPHPFGRTTVIDLHDDRLFAGTGEHFEVQVWTLDGELEWILRGPAVDLTVTDSLRSAYADGRLAETPPERHPALRRELGDMPPIEARTAFTGLRVDAEGVVWLENLSVAPGEPQRWSLMDPERGYLGDLSLPGGHELLEAGAAHVLTLHRDELGVERVVLFPLDRGDGAEDSGR